MKKILIIVAVFFFVLLAAAELYVQSDLFALKLRPYVLRPLQQVLGSDAQIGWVRANLIPLYVEARDISLPDARGKQVVAVHKVKVYINPFALLYKTISLPSVVVLDPRISIDRAKDGQVNIVPVLSKILSNIGRMRGEGDSGYRVLLNSLTLAQGSITFHDNGTAWDVSLSGVQVTTRMNAAGDALSVAVKNAAIRAAAPAYPELSGNLRAAVRYDHDRVHLDAVTLTTADTEISVSGRVGTRPDSDLDVRVKARSGAETIGRLARLLKKIKKEQRAYAEASFAIRGRLNNPVADGTLALSGVSYEGVTLKDATLSFRYENKHLGLSGEKWKLVRADKSIVIDAVAASVGSGPRGLAIDRFDIQAADLSFSLSGRADPERGFDAVVIAESTGKGQTLSLLASVPLQGAVSVKGYLTGVVTDPVFDGSFKAGPLDVKGVLFDNATGGLQYRDKIISLVSVDVHQRTSRYLFNGAVDLNGKEPVLSARLKLIRADIGNIVAIFYEPLPLYFTGTGDLSFNGTVKDFTGSGKLSVDEGRAYGESFKKGFIQAELTKDKISFPEVLIDKGSGTIRGTGWIGFNGTYSASIQSHGVKPTEVDHLAGMPATGILDLSIESSGSFSQPRVDATLAMEEVHLNQASFSPLHAGLEIGEGVLTMQAELSGERALFTGRMALSGPHTWTAHLIVNADALDPALLTDSKDMTGRVKLDLAGDVSAHGTGFDLRNLAATASFNKVGVTVGDYRIENQGPAAASIRGDRFTITSLNLSGQGTSLTVTGGARFLKDVDLSFLGTARLSLLRPLVRDLEYTNGVAEVKLAIKDSWSNPDIAGELFVTNGEIKVKDIPQRFSSLSGKLSFDRSRVMIDSLTGEMGGGTLRASGKAELSGLALQDFSTKVTFENVTVRYPEGLTSTLSGDLSYDGNTAEQSLTGDVQIKRAKYDKRVEWKSMLVEFGKGLYQKKKTEAGWIGDTQINIRFYGRENILFQNNLAKMPLDVDAFLQGTVNHPQLLGRVEARKGSVYFRQNEFKILHASADFVDPNRMNPVIDIQAEIQIREYLVRLGVSGTADRAVVTLISDPSLPDSDILTLLALGKTGDELKGKEAGVGMSEAASFATGQFQDIFESRARSLTGLDRFQIDPYVSKSDTSVPRVTVGKELVQDKLYVTYSSNVGSPTPEQIFRIEYLLNRHFSLVGERNDLGSTGADIKYRFEFK